MTPRNFFGGVAMKLTTVISSQIANLFQKRGEVEPSALIKALEREVVKQKKSLDGINIVPNDYTIFLSEEDCHRLSAARILKSLYETVERKVIRENCFMDGKLNIKFGHRRGNYNFCAIRRKIGKR